MRYRGPHRSLETTQNQARNANQYQTASHRSLRIRSHVQQFAHLVNGLITANERQPSAHHQQGNPELRCLARERPSE